MNPDDQNPPAGGPASPMGGPAADQPVTSTEPVAEQPASPMGGPAATEKCETCGRNSNNGNCSGCYQPNASCSCPPEAPAEENPAEGSAPAAPAM